MLKGKQTINSLTYYLLVTLITTCAFLIPCIIILELTTSFQAGISFFIVLFTVIHTFLISFLGMWMGRNFNRDLSLKVIGIYIGGLSGLLYGGLFISPSVRSWVGFAIIIFMFGPGQYLGLQLTQRVAAWLESLSSVA